VIFIKAKINKLQLIWISRAKPPIKSDIYKEKQQGFYIKSLLFFLIIRQYIFIRPTI
jgi:hypothetical protein